MEYLDQQQFYKIRVRGRLDSRWAIWLYGSEVQINPANITTITVQIPDQSALRGILNRIWDLNLTLISVYGITPKKWTR